MAIVAMVVGDGLPHMLWMHPFDGMLEPNIRRGVLDVSDARKIGRCFTPPSRCDGCIHHIALRRLAPGCDDFGDIGCLDCIDVDDGICIIDRCDDLNCNDLLGVDGEYAIDALLLLVFDGAHIGQVDYDFICEDEIIVEGFAILIDKDDVVSLSVCLEVGDGK